MRPGDAESWEGRLVIVGEQASTRREAGRLSGPLRCGDPSTPVIHPALHECLGLAGVHTEEVKSGFWWAHQSLTLAFVPAVLGFLAFPFNKLLFSFPQKFGQSPAQGGPGTVAEVTVTPDSLLSSQPRGFYSRDPSFHMISPTVWSLPDPPSYRQCRVQEEQKCMLMLDWARPFTV